MSYNNVIARSDANPLMPEEVSNDLLKGLDNESAVLKLFRRVPVGRAQVRFPVLSALPVAYWVTGDSGLKQTTQVSWDNKYLNIEEIAVIVPIPENVVSDSGEPIWDQVKPLCEQAGGRLIDETVFFGSGAPASFPTDVVAAADALGNKVQIGTADPEEGGLVTDHGDLLTLLETQGFAPSTGIAARAFRGPLRQARNANGDRYAEISISKDSAEIDGVTYEFPMRGEWPTTSHAPQAIVFDSNEFVVGVRQDVSWKLLDQAAIFDNNGDLMFNLPQQDMVAMRMTLRVGWQVANTIRYDEENEANRYPAGLLTASS